MKNSPFIRTAITSSFLMALYGLIPIAFFIQPPMKTVFTVFIVFSLGLLFVWTINILVFKLSADYHSFVFYLLSYLCTMSFMVIIGWGVFQFWERPINRTPFPYFPAFTINTLILILMNQVKLKANKEAIEYRLNQSKIKQLEAENQVLAQQLQPHFLFNALSTLKSFVKINPSQAESYIVKLADFLRFTIEIDREQLISLEKEMSFIRDYLDLQQLRFGKGLQCHIQIDSSALIKKLPVFALQTLIENAIKHNGFTLKDPLFINILYNDNSVTVSNNLIPKNKEVKTTPTGLKNLQKRYQIFGSKSIVINDEESSFSVTIPMFNTDYEKSN